MAVAPPQDAENEAALNLAIQLLRTRSSRRHGGKSRSSDRTDQKGEEYIQSLLSAAELKRRTKQIKDDQANYEFQQLILKFD